MSPTFNMMPGIFFLRFNVCTIYSSNYTLHREIQLGKIDSWYFSYEVCKDSILN